MKKIALFFVLAFSAISVMAQVSVWHNGQIVFQQDYALLDSIAFNYVISEEKPEAKFTYLVNDLDFRFINQSKNATSYLWDFGDGITSTEQNPTHTYSSYGNYTITLTAINKNGRNQTSYSVKKDQRLVKIDGDFSDWDALTTNPYLAVTTKPENDIDATNALYAMKFIADEDNVYFYLEFSPESTQEEEQIIHKVNGFWFYLNTDGDGQGVFDPYLWKNSAAEWMIETEWDEQNLETWLYSYSPDTIYNYPTQTEVNLKGFINMNNKVLLPNGHAAVEGVIYRSYFPPFKSFMVGVQSFATNWRRTGVLPARSLTEEGLFTPTMLTVILPNMPPKADFTYSMNETTVTITNTSVGAETCLWDFGDGTTSTERNPVHTYADYGNYTITLTVTNKNGSDQTNKTIALSKKYIVVDGNFEDWGDIPPGLLIGTSPTNNMYENLYTAKFIADKENIYFYLEFNSGTYTTYSGETGYMVASFDIFIDVDGDASTGYNCGEWNNSGADYLLEDYMDDGYPNAGTVFRFMGEEQDNWSFEETNIVSTISNRVTLSNGRAAIEGLIDRSFIPSQQNMVKMGVLCNNFDWSISGCLPAVLLNEDGSTTKYSLFAISLP